MYTVIFLDEACKDIDGLDGSVRLQVLAGIRRVSGNPLPQNEGGYGKPLGNRNGNNLTGLYKIKFSDIGIRVVYALDKPNEIMIIAVVSAREENECYKIAGKRKKAKDNSSSRDKFKTNNF